MSTKISFTNKASLNIDADPKEFIKTVDEALKDNVFIEIVPKNDKKSFYMNPNTICYIQHSDWSPESR